MWRNWFMPYNAKSVTNGTLPFAPPPFIGQFETGGVQWNAWSRSHWSKFWPIETFRVFGVQGSNISFTLPLSSSTCRKFPTTVFSQDAQWSLSHAGVSTLSLPFHHILSLKWPSSELFLTKTTAMSWCSCLHLFMLSCLEVRQKQFHSTRTQPLDWTWSEPRCEHWFILNNQTVHVLNWFEGLFLCSESHKASSTFLHPSRQMQPWLAFTSSSASNAPRANSGAEIGFMV